MKILRKSMHKKMPSARDHIKKNQTLPSLLCCNTLCCVLQHCTAQCFAAMRIAAPRCARLCHENQCSTMRCCTVLRCAMLCCGILLQFITSSLLLTLMPEANGIEFVDHARKGDEASRNACKVYEGCNASTNPILRVKLVDANLDECF